MDTTLVRDAHEDDVDAITRVVEAAWRAGYAGTLPAALVARLAAGETMRSRWAERLADRGGEVAVAVVGGELAGVASFGSARDLHAAAATAELRSLNVAPGRWRAGVGRALVSECARRLADGGYDHLTLWVLAANERALRFYEAVGLRPDGSERRDPRLAGAREVRYSSELGDR